MRLNFNFAVILQKLNLVFLFKKLKMSSTQECRSCKNVKAISEFPMNASGKTPLKTCTLCKDKPSASTLKKQEAAERKAKRAEAAEQKSRQLNSKKVEKLAKLLETMDLSYKDFKQSLQKQPWSITEILENETKFAEAKNAIQQMIVKDKSA
jgi:putative cell wall-binding protein